MSEYELEELQKHYKADESAGNTERGVRGFFNTYFPEIATLVGIVVLTGAFIYQDIENTRFNQNRDRSNVLYIYNNVRMRHENVTQAKGALEQYPNSPILNSIANNTEVMNDVEREVLEEIASK